MPALIQLAENSENIKLFWEIEQNPSVIFFKLYWSLDQETGFVLLATNIANQASIARRYTGYNFTRSSIGLTEKQPFFLRITTVDDSLVESPPGDVRRIPAVLDEPPTVGTTEVAYTQPHGWDKLANTWRRLNSYARRDGTSELIQNAGLLEPDVKSKLIGTISEQILFDNDVKVVEVFNYSSSNIIFVDTTGQGADPDKHMPVLPQTYYVFEINIAKENGIAIISSGSSTDVRIIGHFG